MRPGASSRSRKEITRRLRYIPPATSFRSAYAYDNVLYLVAGEVIEAVSGRSWEDLVGSRHSRESGYDGQQRPPFRGSGWRKRCRSSRTCRRNGASNQAVRQRQHELCGGHQEQRGCHGEVDDRAAGARPAAQRVIAFFRDNLGFGFVLPARRVSLAIWSTGSTTRSSRAGMIASCAPMPSSPSPSTRTGASTRQKYEPSPQRPTSASISRTCGSCPRSANSPASRYS